MSTNWQQKFLQFQNMYQPEYKSKTGNISIKFNGRLEVISMNIAQEKMDDVLIEDLMKLLNSSYKDSAEIIKRKFTQLSSGI